jgi:hypothetical protein
VNRKIEAIRREPNLMKEVQVCDKKKEYRILLYFTLFYLFYLFILIFFIYFIYFFVFWIFFTFILLYLILFCFISFILESNLNEGW